LGVGVHRLDIFSGIVFAILLSIGVMAGLAKPQPTTVVVNTPYGSYVTTTYVSFVNIAPAGGVLVFVSFIFIIAFVLMFMYSSGLIYVGANKVKYGAVEGITCT
jgi:hypothetical protein